MSYHESCAGLATSMEEAADHFAVGAAFTITRFFFRNETRDIEKT